MRNPLVFLLFMALCWLPTLMSAPKTLEDYNAAIAENPKDAAAYSDWGLFYHRDLGKVEEALADYNKLLELAPESVEHYPLLISAYLEKTCE